MVVVAALEAMLEEAMLEECRVVVLMAEVAAVQAEGLAEEGVEAEKAAVVMGTEAVSEHSDRCVPMLAVAFLRWNSVARENGTHALPAPLGTSLGDHTVGTCAPV